MKTQQIIAAVLMLIVLSFATYKATRPDPSLLRFEVEGNRAYGYGVTDERSAGVIKDLIRDHPQVDTLILKYMPGTENADTNLGLARRIRKLGLKTHLEPDSRIASGAVDLFLAGTERTMECGARIGVHSWGHGIGEGAKEMLFDSRKRIQEDFLKDMGIDPNFYIFTREAAAANDIHIMSTTEIERFNLLTTSISCG